MTKAALITGASSGIGEEFARRLAARGHDLVLVARNDDKLHSLCDELMLEHDITAHYTAIDLSERDADERLFEETERHGFEIDWLINNAGFGSGGYFSELDAARELKMIDLNIRALVALTHRYLQKMRERGEGTIINVSSTAAFQPMPFRATYAATKAFVSSFTEAIAEENRHFGIRIMALCPGSTATNFFAASEVEPTMRSSGQQTVGEVVETALAAIEKGRSKVVSGWVNYIGALGASYMPNAVTTRLIGRGLRKRYAGDKSR
jgi:short-subunit dehydrogenase